MDEKLIEKTVKKNMTHKGKILELFCDDVKLPNGEFSTREYVNHRGAAAVLPFLDKTTIVLVKQFRYVINQVTYEIPAGKIDKDETPLKCAVRELEEETGFRAENCKDFASFYPSCGVSNEIVHLFLAFDLKKGTPKADKDEFVSKEIVDFKNAIKMVKKGQIRDAKTIIALFYFKELFA
jgi:ADP-ribose pyrophosphatase